MAKKANSANDGDREMEFGSLDEDVSYDGIDLRQQMHFYEKASLDSTCGVHPVC